MFTHRSIANPSNFAPFEHTFSFFWNSTDKVTVFKFTAWVKDAKEKESNVSLLGQRLEINLIRMDENQCFIIFKHIILEFIPFDVLMSYSSSKKKVLRKVKNILEGKSE